MNEQFLNDVISGLSAIPKKLDSKYFYNAEGDALFQKIMQSDEYYLTNCEFEIFKARGPEIAALFKSKLHEFDLLELGAGDASKSSYLLQALVDKQTPFTYMPIDISASIIDYLKVTLPEKVPGLHIHGLNGEYFPMVEKAKEISSRRKAVLFLGGNIGNMNPSEALSFCNKLHGALNKGDYVMIGFDLRKNPHAIFNAYNDSEGYTKAFNLNLLRRINDELGGDIEISNFEHYNSYDPLTGACKSYLFSLEAQEFKIAGQRFQMDAAEVIDMEISQKYSLEEVLELANQTNFGVVETFFDSKRWFLDILWEVK